MLKDHVISDEAFDDIQAGLANHLHWLAYNTMNYFLEKGDVYFFKTKDEANEFVDNNISDHDNFRVIQVSSVAEVMREIPHGEELDNLMSDTNVNGLFNKDGNAFTDALIEDIEQKQFIHSNKTNVMNEKNFEYLKSQILKTGFGEAHSEELKTKMQSGAPEFVIGHTADYGKDSTAATLQFKKSANTDMYFFNSYNLHLKNAQHPEPIKQTFYTDDHFSLKEGYNLLSGRAVLKEKENKEGQRYTAWFQLDFKQDDKNGNFKLHPYHSNYGYDLPKELEKHSIKELSDPTQREYLMKALARGNRQQVTLVDGGQEQKVFLETAPQFKSLNFYDAGGNRLKAGQVYENKAGQQQGTTVKQQAEQLNDKASNQSEKQVAGKETQKQNTTDGEEGGAGKTKQGQGKSRRSRQSIS